MNSTASVFTRQKFYKCTDLAARSSPDLATRLSRDLHLHRRGASFTRVIRAPNVFSSPYRHFFTKFASGFISCACVVFFLVRRVLSRAVTEMKILERACDKLKRHVSQQSRKRLCIALTPILGEQAWAGAAERALLLTFTSARRVA